MCFFNAKQRFQVLSDPGPPDPSELRVDMDCIHKRLRQIAHYEQPDDETGNPPCPSGKPLPPVDLGDNLLTFEPFKHRKFQLCAPGRGGVATSKIKHC